MEVPQQVNPFQNVLNTSLLLIRLSKYLPKVTQKNSREKQKGKSGKDETSRIVLEVNSIFLGKKKLRGEKQKSKEAKKSFGKFQFFQKKKKFRGTKKKENKSRGWRSKIKSLYPYLVARKQFSQEKLTTGKLTRLSIP